MVNNFERFGELMRFTDKHDFYFVNILRRKKDHPEQSKSEKFIDAFYIYSLAQYEEFIPKMIKQADKEEARVYVRVNKRNDITIGMKMIKEVVELVDNQAYTKLKRAYTSVCGSYSSEKERKIYTIDVDNLNMDYLLEVVNYVDSLRKKYNSPTLIHTFVKSLNGYHILTSPFNIKEFKIQYPHIDVSDDASTLLYVNL